MLGLIIVLKTFNASSADNIKNSHKVSQCLVFRGIYWQKWKLVKYGSLVCHYDVLPTALVSVFHAKAPWLS